MQSPPPPSGAVSPPLFIGGPEGGKEGGLVAPSPFPSHRQLRSWKFPVESFRENPPLLLVRRLLHGI